MLTVKSATLTYKVTYLSRSKNMCSKYIKLQFREAFHRLFDSCNNHRRKYCGKGNQKMCEKQYQNEEAFYQHGQTMFRTTMRTFLGQSISQFQTQFTIQTVSWQRRTCRNSKSYKIVCL